MNWWFITSGVIQLGASVAELCSRNYKWGIVYGLIAVVNIIIGTKP